MDTEALVFRWGVRQDVWKIRLYLERRETELQDGAIKCEQLLWENMVITKGYSIDFMIVEFKTYHKSS